jgi:UDP-N-acetylglucosamine:LPS N-acetylglucosamine transferase
LKKVIIFTCIGGHNVISQALETSLQGSYQVVVKNIFLDILRSVDPIRFLTLGFYNAEDFYSLCIRRGWYSFMNKSYKHGIIYADIMSGRVRSLIKKTIVESEADCIISVIPFFNSYFLSIAKELDIPFVLMPTDIDATTFIYHLETPLAYEKFHFAIAIDTPEIHEKIAPLKLSESQIHVTGVALKPGFFAQYDQVLLKKRFEIPENKPIILLLMGSQGSETIVDFMKELSRIKDVPFHLIVVLGKHCSQYKTIAKIVFDPEVTTSFFGFTPLIPELMAISSLLITKSGGISISEALYMNLPTLLDATSEVLVWEQMNQTFMQKNRFGTSVYHLNELSKMVKAFLTSRAEMLEAYRNNMLSFEKKNGCDGVKLLLNQLIDKTTGA